MISSISSDGEVMSRETLKFIKIKCRACGHLNLIPVIRRFRLYGTIKCEKCGKMIATLE